MIMHQLLELMCFCRWVRIEPRFWLCVSLLKPLMSDIRVRIKPKFWLWISPLKPLIIDVSIGSLVEGEPCKTLYYGYWVSHVKPIMVVKGEPCKTLYYGCVLMFNIN